MLDSPAYKVLQKTRDKIFFQVFHKNGDQLNENLSQEIIFFATTLPLVAEIRFTASNWWGL